MLRRACGRAGVRAWWNSDRGVAVGSVFSQRGAHDVTGPDDSKRVVR